MDNEAISKLKNMILVIIVISKGTIFVILMISPHNLRQNFHVRINTDIAIGRLVTTTHRNAFIIQTKRRNPLRCRHSIIKMAISASRTHDKDSYNPCYNKC